MRPVVGITCSYNTALDQYHLARDYVRAVKAAGGDPVILPHTGNNNVRSLLNVIDGLLLSGGGDIDPYHFGEEPWPENGSIDPHRDSFELQITMQALEVEMPVFGICRGIQILNVAAGGTVCQDIQRAIPGAYKHSQEAPRWYPTHEIEIKQDSLLFDLLAAHKFRVNSFHHQMIGQTAEGFTVSARAGDGVIEAIERTDKNSFAMGVQFHPENMWEKYPAMLQLFIAHVQASARYLSNRNYRVIQEKVKSL